MDVESAIRVWEPLVTTPVAFTGTTVAEVDHFSIYSGTADQNLLQTSSLEAYQTDLHTGASQVNIPIQVPKGRGGLQPDLSLTYNSNLVNEMKDPLSQGSWAGVGWDLNVGSINKVFTSGGTRYFLNMNGVSDEMFEDPDASQSHVYRTRNDEYLRIQQVGSCDPVSTGLLGNPTPTPPCRWVVTDKQGTSYSFGGVSSYDPAFARYYDLCWSNPAGFQLFYYRWDLAQVTDARGNSASYHFDQQPLTDVNIPNGPCHVGTTQKDPSHGSSQPTPTRSSTTAITSRSTSSRVQTIPIPASPPWLSVTIVLTTSQPGAAQQPSRPMPISLKRRAIWIAST